MKHLLIIGVGVLSDIVYEYAVKSLPYNRDYDFKGYLFSACDDSKDILRKKPIAEYENYEVEPDDVFICSYFSNEDRCEVYNKMIGKKAQFINIIHPTANIFNNVKIGVGNVIGAFTTLSANVVIGDMNIIQDNSNIGHDTQIGNYNHLFVGTILCGKNQIYNKTSIYTGALIYPSFKIGNSAIVAAGSVVMRSVKDGFTVMGNPAKKVENN